MLGHHLRAAVRVAPGRRAVWVGLRVAAAIGVPLLLAAWLDPQVVRWASFAGYSIALVDAGGSYRARASAMLFASLVTVIAVGTGTLVAGSALAPLVVVAGLTACAFGHIGGLAGARTTIPIAIAFALSCYTAERDVVAMAPVIGAVMGASWAMLLSLLLWPVRVYKPGRHALSNVFASLAEHAGRIADGASPEELRQQHRSLRERIEVARAALVATRRARGERDRGERLVALTQVCDRIFGVQLALEELLDGFALRDERVVVALRGHGSQLGRLAELILLERSQPHAIASTGMETPRDPVGNVLASLAEQVGIASRLVTSLESAPRIAYGHDVKPSRVERLRSVLDLRAVVTRHALRVALTIGVTVTLIGVWHLQYGYWLVVTAYLLLQPYRASTVTLALQRALGTVLGATIAFGLTTYVRDPTILAVVTVVLVGSGAAVMHLSFGLFSMFLTPSFILIAELHTNDFALAGDRIAYTVVGVTFAVAAILLLWPRRESEVFDDSMTMALDACARYAGVIRQVVVERAPEQTSPVLEARRQLGLSLVNAEVALDRLVQDGATVEITEPRQSALATMHRIAGALNVLARVRADSPHEAEVGERTARIERRLRELVDVRSVSTAAETRHTPPRDERDVASFALRRLEQYVDSLTSALERRATVAPNLTAAKSVPPF